MIRTTLKARESLASIEVSHPQGDGIAEASALFTRIAQSLSYYNEVAKRSEILKYSPRRLEEMIAEDVESVQIATVDTQVVAFCFSSLDDGLVWLSWFGVNPKFRRRGIGAALLSALNERAKRAGAHKIWCDSRPNNLESHGTLLACGYRELCLLVNHWYGQDFILWERCVA